ncbi:MAG: hypothetical protein JW781_03490 [Deltaproteobacteria bacterium]|nr:hypothetical protein [Candidatus Anaeroferrophillacea bacterium]
MITIPAKKRFIYAGGYSNKLRRFFLQPLDGLMEPQSLPEPLKKGRRRSGSGVPAHFPAPEPPPAGGMGREGA